MQDAAGAKRPVHEARRIPFAIEDVRLRLRYRA